MKIQDIYPLKHAWDLQTDSPGIILKPLTDVFIDTGYRIHKTPATLKEGIPSPTTGVTIAEVVGRKIVAVHQPKLVLRGLILLAIAAVIFAFTVPGKIGGLDAFGIVVGIILSALSVLFIIASPALYRLSMVGRVNRETSAMDILTAEIIGNYQVIWGLGARRNRDKSKVAKEHKTLQDDFKELQFRLDRIWPPV